jgi:hypothetical protein
MAKATKNAPAPANPEGAQLTEAERAAKRAERDARAKNDRFTRVMIDGVPAKLDPAKRLAPQAQVIVNGIEAAGSGGITREHLEKALTGVLVTRQPVGRIISYYQKLITDELQLVTLVRA